MHLINVTNSYARTISQELRESSVHFIKIFTLGNSKVVLRKRRGEAEIVISNKIRPITEREIDFVKSELLGKNADDAKITQRDKIVEISLDHD